MYKISKGQLIVIWLFAIIGWIWAINVSCDFFGGYCSSANAAVAIRFKSDLLIYILPFVMIFYTIGWRNYRKRAKGN